MSNLTISLPVGTEWRLRQQAADQGRSLEALLAEIATREVNRQTSPDDSSRNLDPLVLNQIEHDGVVYSLREPLVFQADVAEGYWTFHNDILNLLGSADSLSDALDDLSSNFAYLWKEIACEADDVLDAPARRIKTHLRELVVNHPE